MINPKQKEVTMAKPPQKPKAYNVKTYMKGQMIFKEGDPGTDAYLVRTGTVDIYKVMNNKKILLERIQPGEVFGEMSILSKLPRSANAIANEYVELVVINKQDLELSVQKSLPIVQALSNLLIKRLRRTNEMINEHPTNNLFLSVCNMLYLMDKNQRMVNSCYDQSLIGVDVGGLIHSETSRKMKEILSLSQIEIDTVLKYLVELGLISIDNAKISPMIIKKVVRILDPDKFMDLVNEYAKDWKPESGAFVQDLEFIDLTEFARIISSSPDIVLKRMSKGDIPTDLVYIHKASAIAWAEQNK